MMMLANQATGITFITQFTLYIFQEMKKAGQFSISVVTAVLFLQLINSIGSLLGAVPSKMFG